MLIHNGGCQIYHSDKGLIMQTTMSSNRMFVIHAEFIPANGACFKTDAGILTQLWHCRFGNLGFKD